MHFSFIIAVILWWIYDNKPLCLRWNVNPLWIRKIVHYFNSYLKNIALVKAVLLKQAAPEQSGPSHAWDLFSMFLFPKGAACPAFFNTTKRHGEEPHLVTWGGHINNLIKVKIHQFSFKCGCHMGAHHSMGRSWGQEGSSKLCPSSLTSKSVCGKRAVCSVTNCSYHAPHKPIFSIWFGSEMGS